MLPFQIEFGVILPIGLVCFAEKTSRNTVPADLLREKNTVSSKKTSSKVRIIREANSAIISYNLEEILNA